MTWAASEVLAPWYQSRTSRRCAYEEEPSPRGEGSGMSDRSERIVKKLWSYCQVLRDDGLSYQDYLEQLTFLLFLKMADERQRAGLGEVVPIGLDWQSLLDRASALAAG